MVISVAKNETSVYIILWLFSTHLISRFCNNVIISWKLFLVLINYKLGPETIIWKFYQPNNCVWPSESSLFCLFHSSTYSLCPPPPSLLGYPIIQQKMKSIKALQYSAKTIKLWNMKTTTILLIISLIV